MRLLNHFARTTKVRYDPLDQNWSKVGITTARFAMIVPWPNPTAAGAGSTSERRAIDQLDPVPVRYLLFLP